jgi:hypothetical protein
LAGQDSILIDIDQSGVAYDAEESAFIHRHALELVLAALNAPNEMDEGPVADTDRPRELSVRRSRRHDAVLVSARRGEGKTTFLATVLRSIEDDARKRRQDRRGGQTMYSLGIIDPTLIETKQNIIVIVIDLIRIAAEHRRKRLGHGPEDFEVVQRALRKLAQGLTVLDGIGDSIYSGRDWVDADFVLDKGLENASAAHGFERRLHDYIAVVADYVGVDAFVLAVDDVDTRFDSGWPVLEAIRKYLVTPHLRIILSGDLNLYSLLVRQQQWAQMTPAFLNAEARRGEADDGSSQLREIGRMVDALQDQYLIKVAPPENRVELRSLEYHAARRMIHLRGGGLAEPVSIWAFINAVSERLLGLRSAADRKLVRTQILRLPIRSALQTLRGVAAFAGHAETMEGEDWARAIDTLRHVAWTPLMAIGVDVNGSRDTDSTTVIGSITEWLTRSGLWLQMARFHPVGTDEYQDMAAIYFGSVLMNLFRRNPGKMIEYWVKIATVREKIDGGAVDDASKDHAAGSVVHLVSHLNLRADENPVQTVSRLAAWEAVERVGVRSTTRGMRFSGVSVPLDRVRTGGAAPRSLYGSALLTRDGRVDVEQFSNFRSRSLANQEALLAKVPAPMRGYLTIMLHQNENRTGPFSGFFANGVEDLAERLDPDARTALLLPRSRVVTGQSYETGNYSFLRVIGVIGELIQAASANRRGLKSEIRKILFNATQARSYPTPRAIGEGIDIIQTEDGEGVGDADSAEHGIDIHSDQMPNDIGLDTLLYNWLVHHRDRDFALAPVTLSRMWTRFTYASTNVRSALRGGETRYLGILIHRTLVAFLHAVGLEAMRATDRQPSAGATGNPVRSSHVFVNLLEDIYGDSDPMDFHETPEHAFFDLLLSCPLWSYYLAQPASHHDEGDPFDEGMQAPDMRLMQIYLRRMRAAQSDSFDLHGVVGLRSPRGGIYFFTGLHALLNSIPIQGEQDAEPKQSAAKPRTRQPGSSSAVGGSAQRGAAEATTSRTP